MNPYVKKYLPPLIGGYYNLLSYISPRMAGKKAFYTFSTVRKGKVLPQQIAFLNAAKKERLQVGEHNIQVYEWLGDGETVLLMHGWESNVFRWRNLIAVLQESKFHIIAFDTPGHGFSDGTISSAIIASECAHAVIGRYGPHHLVGHSMGGMAAIYTLAHSENNRVKKLVTLGAPNAFSELVAEYQQLLGFNSRVYDALDDYIFKKYQYRIKEFTTARFAALLKLPGLIIHDRDDAIIPIHASRQIHQVWPGSTLMETDGLGHSLHQEAVNRTIAGFLKS